MTLTASKAEPVRRCLLRSTCRAKSNRRFFNEMLSEEWEVLVIKRDAETGEYGFKTACCVKCS